MKPVSALLKLTVQQPTRCIFKQKPGSPVENGVTAANSFLQKLTVSYCKLKVPTSTCKLDLCVHMRLSRERTVFKGPKRS